MAGPPTRDNDRLHRLIYRLTAGFLFAATVLRSVLTYDGRDLLAVLSLLAAWLVLPLADEWARGARARRAVRAVEATGADRPGGRRVAPSSALLLAAYLIVECALIALLLLVGGDSGDFFAILMAILGMQVVRRARLRSAVAVLALFVPVMYVPLAVSYDPIQALVFTMIYSAATALVAAYSLASLRAVEATAANESLAVELRAANREIEAYSAQLGRLAAARERHRLAHDLHDSVTQTIFSMTLTTQSAALLLERDRSRVAVQLDRLAQLTRGALSEMQLLISELTPDRRLEGGLLANLERHLAERAAPLGLDVAVEVTGEGTLSPAEEQNLLRIAQEAVNNIVKHAAAATAAVRLTLVPPYRLEIEDEGRGFDTETAGRAATAGTPDAHGASSAARAPGTGALSADDGGASSGTGSRRHGHGLGLPSMRERAAEIGWSFEVRSRPGRGTSVMVEAPREPAATSSTGTTGRAAAEGGGARAEAAAGGASAEGGKEAGRDG